MPAATRMPVVVTSALIKVMLSIFFLLFLFESDFTALQLFATPYFGKSRIIASTAGPKITTIKAGNIKNTRAGTIFTDVFALISSARCRRFVRRSSE